MKVTLIIPSYNRPTILKNTLKKLCKCFPRPNEIIVVEQSAKVNPGLQKAISRLGSHCTLLKQVKPNAQMARNEAARKASSEILLFIDDDVDPDPSLIQAHLANYEDPKVQAVAGFYLEPGEEKTNRTRPIIWWRPLTAIEKIPAFLHTK